MNESNHFKFTGYGHKSIEMKKDNMKPIAEPGSPKETLLDFLWFLRENGQINVTHYLIAAQDKELIDRFFKWIKKQ